MKTHRTVFGDPENDGDTSTSPPFTRRYSYEELDHEPRRTYSPSNHGFKYEQANDESRSGLESPLSAEKRRAHAQAFNYAPGEGEKVVEVAEKKKMSGRLSASPPGANSSLSSPDNTLPETSVDDSHLNVTVDESHLNTSADSTGIITAFGFGKKNKKDKKTSKKDKKNKESKIPVPTSDKKGKDGKKSSKEQVKSPGGGSGDKDKSKKKGKFGIFGKKDKESGNTKGKGKGGSSSSSSSSSSDSDSDSDSDESVIKEVREGTEPKDVDDILAQSDASFAADHSNASMLVNMTAHNNDPSFTADHSASDIVVNPAIRDSLEEGPKIVKTTTKKTYVQDDGGVTEGFVSHVEDMSSGTVQVESENTQVGILLTLIIYN